MAQQLTDEQKRQLKQLMGSGELIAAEARKLVTQQPPAEPAQKR